MCDEQELRLDNAWTSGTNRWPRELRTNICGPNYAHPCFLKDTPSTSTLKELDRLLHPRVPSLVRAPLHFELLSLSRTEESVEEQEIRESLRLSVVLPSSETTGAETPPSISTSMPALLSHHPNPNTLSDVDEPEMPTPQPPLYPQASTPPDLRPALVPSHVSSVSSPAQIPSMGRLYSNDTLCPPEADGVTPSSMSGVVTASEGSHLGTVLGATNAVQEDDDDEDEEMPSIDMGSDSD
jgi:pre-rRNA-processing protein RIX1